MQLSYIPVPDQPGHLAAAAIASREYKDLSEAERRQLHDGECPREDYKRRCDKWWAHSSVDIAPTELQRGVWMALQKIGVSTS